MTGKSIKFMKTALELAKKAYNIGEVPVGCVIVKHDEIVGQGYNTVETERNALKHAEIRAIEQACANTGGRILDGCELYVTLEPCPMCAGAILNSRISRIYYGAADARMGACGSVINLFYENFGIRPEITGGILKDECSEILTRFFRQIRD